MTVDGCVSPPSSNSTRRERQSPISASIWDETPPPSSEKSVWAGVLAGSTGIDLLGSGGTADVVGIYYGEHEQVLDYRLLIDHFGPSTSSKVFLKGAVEDSASSVFTGMVKIEPDAAKTSAFETNRNLVLSDGAKASSVPNLEILCNDVICGHASSVGPLDEDQLYYLESRGLPSDRAARL